MTSALDQNKEKYLSYLNPEKYFTTSVKEKPLCLDQRSRNSKFVNEQSRLRNLGLQYISSKGKVLPSKEMAFVQCNCPLRCWEKFDKDKLSEFFNEFWRIGKLESRRNFILRYCYRNLSPRYSKVGYHLPGHLSLKNGKMVEVCRVFFTSILDLTTGFIMWTLKYKDSKNFIHAIPDQRRGQGTNRLTETQFREIGEVFVGEVVHPSHYSRRDSQKLYFSKSQSVASFYRKYKLHDVSDVKKVSESTFRKVIKISYPEIKFAKKKRDKCDSCRLYETSSKQARIMLQDSYLQHLMRKDEARKAKAADIEAAKADFKRYKTQELDRQLCVFEVDLEKTLPVPCCTQAYYSVFQVYHLTVLDHGTNDVYSFVWDESQGAKSSIEVATCLYRLLMTRVPRSVRNVVIWQDNAIGQSKNRFVVCSLFHVLWRKKSFIESIELKFPEPGHTDLVLDWVHSVIERKAQSKTAPQIGHPDDWLQIISSCRPNQPFIIIHMNHDDFFDWKRSNTKQLYSDSFENFRWKDGVNWRITKMSLCSRNRFLENDPCESYRVNANYFRNLSLNYGPPKAYQNRRKISISKLESIMKYINNAKIPRSNLMFFYDLPIDGDPQVIDVLKSTMKNRFDTEIVL